MARTKATEAQRDEVRRKIRRAAADVYNEGGIAGTSARSIAKRAGVSVGTIYTYFGSLTGLLETLWMGPVVRASTRLEEIAADEPDPLKRLERLADGYISFAMENPEIYRSVFLFVRPLKEVQANRPPFSEVVFPKLLIKAISDGQASGAIVEGDPEMLSQTFWAGVHGALGISDNMSRFQFSETEVRAKAMTRFLVDALQTP